MQTMLGPLDPEALKKAYLESMRRLPSGVVLVISKVSGRPWGLTVSACCSTSADPPILSVSVDSGTATAESIRQEGRFGVAILDHNHLPLAEFGSARGIAKFIDNLCDDVDSPFPRLRDCTAQLQCVVAASYVVADHTIFVGQVVDGRVTAGAPDRALVYYDRAYWDLACATPPAPGGVYKEERHGSGA
ncbi:flavin reductase family protein [Pseudonocardia sp. H11422]|uniref:flavin reductase family protein n=1 Tax=Pseudonocardia sp. H11422 TaxID=2835866 RepID=UPI001BDD13DC|nr:flavin reductase family protein [Pseudonocardia sp. H11422]